MFFRGRTNRSAEFGLESKRIKSLPPKKLLTINEKWIDIISKNNFDEAEKLILFFPNSLNSSDNYPLRYACRYGDSHLNLINLMLLKGADPSDLEGEALIDATSRGYYEVVRLITTFKGKSVRPSCQNYLPYYAAAYYGHFHILEFFIKEYGKPPNQIIQSILSKLAENENLQKTKEFFST